jgi:geranylgeranyl diphosphate synthase type II
MLQDRQKYASRVIEAMNYSVESGGKRLRPMLMLETFSMYEPVDTDVLGPFMAAIEMIHTYSLVHDDLPEMDNDEFRRGRRTTHTVYGQGMAVLAGDGLLNYAYETIAALLSDTEEGETALAHDRRFLRAFLECGHRRHGRRAVCGPDGGRQEGSHRRGRTDLHSYA